MVLYVTVTFHDSGSLSLFALLCIHQASVMVKQIVIVLQIVKQV